MKRFFLALALAALAVAACAQTVIRESSVPVAWDAVTTDEAGTPLLPEDEVLYRVYIEDTRGGAATLLGEVAATAYTVAVPYRSTWRIGVSASLDGNESAKAWSTVAEDVADGETFVVRPKGIPQKPEGLRQ